MASCNISIPDSLLVFVKEQVATGRFSSVSEYFRSLVRSDKDDIAQSYIEECLLEGLQSGSVVTMNAEKWKRLDADISKRLAA